MELHSNPLSSSSWKRQWRRRKYYRRVDSDVASRKNIKIVRLGGKAKRVWKIRGIRKLRFNFASPLKLWKNFKTAYVNMMLSLSGNVGALNNGNDVFGGKRIPDARQFPLAHTRKTEFEHRLIYEIYKSLSVSTELNPR